MTILEASERLKVLANDLIGHPPACVDVILDLEKTAYRLKQHGEKLVEYCDELTAIRSKLESLQ